MRDDCLDPATVAVGVLSILLGAVITAVIVWLTSQQPSEERVEYEACLAAAEAWRAEVGEWDPPGGIEAWCASH